MNETHLRWELRRRGQDKEFQALLEHIGPLLAEARTNEVPLPVSGLTYPDRDAGNYYIQYSRDCERKYEMTDWFIKEKIAKKLPIRSYEVNREIVAPSTRTIDIRGRHWADGEEDVPQTS